MNLRGIDDMVEVSRDCLDLGCGNRRYRYRSVIGVDIRKGPGVLQHDVNIFPWPFKDATFDLVVALNSLEHFGPLGPIFKELSRVMKSGGIFASICPHYTNPSAYSDPTHNHFMGLKMLEAFTGGHRDGKVAKVFCCDVSVLPQSEDFELISSNFTFRLPYYFTLVPLIARFWPSFFETYLSNFVSARDVITVMRKK